MQPAEMYDSVASQSGPATNAPTKISGETKRLQKQLANRACADKIGDKGDGKYRGGSKCYHDIQPNCESIDRTLCRSKNVAVDIEE